MIAAPTYRLAHVTVAAGRWGAASGHVMAWLREQPAPCTTREIAYAMMYKIEPERMLRYYRSRLRNEERSRLKRTGIPRQRPAPVQSLNHQLATAAVSYVGHLLRQLYLGGQVVRRTDALGPRQCSYWSVDPTFVRRRKRRSP